MHETSVMISLLTRVEAEARAAGASRVTVIRLRAGELSGVEPVSLLSAFDLLAPGTIAEGARLEIEPEPLVADCVDCGHRFRVEAFRFSCPTCHGGQTRIAAGNDLMLESVTVAP
jgi:hydrogenase nickel incorporation protein HypA/HybF